MKIVFINPPSENLVLTNLPEAVAQEEILPSLGLLYVAGYLEKYTEHEIKVIDCLIEDLGYDQLKQRLKQEKPDVVGITALTFTLVDVVKTARVAKETNPEIKVILGGAHVNIYPEETIKFPVVDFLVLGEGEQPALDLIENINQPEKLFNVKGIVFKHQDKIINTGPRELIKDLDFLPFPARHLTPYQKYYSVFSKVSPVTTMFSSRGCHFRCIFCNRAHLGKTFRANSAKKVVEEMEKCQKMGIKEIFFYDDTFTIDRQRVLDICQEIKKRNLNINWDIRARVDTVDKEVLEKMKQAGCQRIHFGVEAGNQKILNAMRKGITLEQVEKAFALSRKTGIQTLAYFMLGSPEETRKEILATIKFARKIKPDFVCFSITTPYPQTDLYTKGLEEKILPYDYWKEFAQNPSSDFTPFLWEEKLSGQELISLFKKSYRSFYIRPGYVFKKILQLKSAKELAIKAKAGLKVLKI